MKTRFSSFISMIIMMLFFTNSFASPIKIGGLQEVKSTWQSISKSEANLIKLVTKRNARAKKILENRIKKIQDDYAAISQVQSQALIDEWQLSRIEFLDRLGAYSDTQNELNNASLQQLTFQSLASVAGATMASVNFVQFNYGRDSIRRTAPQHLQGMASLLRSGASSVQGFITGFLYTEATLRELSNSLSQVEGNIALEGDINNLLLNLDVLQMQSQFVAFVSREEADKARFFSDLLTRIKIFSNQSSTNTQLQALIHPSNDHLYPDGALASIRSIIVTSGTAWLNFAPEIYENVLLTTSFISEIHGTLAQMISSEAERIQSNTSFDQIHYLRLFTNTSLRLIDCLKSEYGRLMLEREKIAVLLINTASQINNNPSAAGTRFQRLMSDLTSLRNSMREIGEEMLYITEQLAEDIIPLQTTVETSLNSLGSIRSRYKASVLMIPIDFDLVNDFISLLENKEPITFGAIPNYWYKVANAKVNTQINQSIISSINRCLSLLTDEDLLFDLKTRKKRVSSCLSRPSNQIGKKKLTTFIQLKINKVKQKRFIEAFENDFYGESLISYVSTMSLNPEPDEDTQYE